VAEQSEELRRFWEGDLQHWDETAIRLRSREMFDLFRRELFAGLLEQVLSQQFPLKCFERAHNDDPLVKLSVPPTSRSHVG
jgi:hypothetical protein